MVLSLHGDATVKTQHRLAQKEDAAQVSAGSKSGFLHGLSRWKLKKTRNSLAVIWQVEDPEFNYRTYIILRF